jgi:uncharacterized protein
MDNMFMPQTMKPSKPGIMSIMLKKLWNKTKM